MSRPRPAVPSVDASNEEARALVLAASPALAKLVPGERGMTCKTWQQLATLAGPPPADGALTMKQWLEAARARRRSSAADPRLEENPSCPDLRWLGIVVESWDVSYGYTTDYTSSTVHPQATDLRYPQHRGRFGEKALRHGGVDFALRALECFPADMQVGYGGVLEIFNSATFGPRSLLHHLPKLEYFLERRAFDEHVAPRLGLYPPARGSDGPPTAQNIANTLLSRLLADGYPWRDECTVKAIIACRSRLGAQLTCEDGHECPHVSMTIGGWGELFGYDDKESVILLFYAILRSGPEFRPYARGRAKQAKALLETMASWGVDWDDMPFTKRELVELCARRLAFTANGLTTLVERTGGLELPARLTGPRALERIDLERDRDALGTAVGVVDQSVRLPRAPGAHAALAMVWLAIDDRLKNWA